MEAFEGVVIARGVAREVVVVEFVVGAASCGDGPLIAWKELELEERG